MTVDLGVAFEDGYEGPYVKSLNAALFDMDRDGTIDDIVRSYSIGSRAGDKGAQDE